MDDDDYCKLYWQLYIVTVDIVVVAVVRYDRYVRELSLHVVAVAVVDDDDGDDGTDLSVLLMPLLWVDMVVAAAAVVLLYNLSLPVYRNVADDVAQL